MSPLDSFWNGVLSLLTPLVTPDWGKLIGLIPFLLLGLVLLYLVLQARAWVRLSRTMPKRGPKGRPRDLRPILAAHFAVMAVGIVTVIAAFIAGSQDPSWTGATSPLGLLVYFPLLLLGLALVIGAAGSLIRIWDRNGRTDIDPDFIDRVNAWIARHPGRTKRSVTFVAGVMIAAVGIALGTIPGWTTAAEAAATAANKWPEVTSPEPVPVAVVPILLVGLALAVGAVGSGIWAEWRRSTADDPSDIIEEGSLTALVPVEH
jgi:hypothetical protein